MKSRCRTVLVALVAVLAFSTLASASASAALPELVNKTGAQLEYEFFKSSTAVYTQFEGSVNLAGPDNKFSCTGMETLGIFTSVKGAKLHVTYSGCTKPNATTCTTPGQATGVIETRPLIGKPVYLVKPPTSSVALLLEPAASQGLFMEIVCGTGHIKVGVHEAGKGGLDTILLPIGNPNQKTTELKLTGLTCSEPGGQNKKSWWDGAKTVSGFLEDEFKIFTGTWELFCERSEEGKLIFEEEVELKA